MRSNPFMTGRSRLDAAIAEYVDAEVTLESIPYHIKDLACTFKEIAQMMSGHISITKLFTLYERLIEGATAVGIPSKVALDMFDAIDTAVETQIRRIVESAGRSGGE